MSHARAPRGFLRQHSLSLVVAAILLFLFVMYRRSDPSTHVGSFYGNAIADWPPKTRKHETDVISAPLVSLVTFVVTVVD
jgi:hypothetical protein